MGQQQILLLVVAAIVVILAIAIGMDMFAANAQTTNRDNIVTDLNNLGTLALQYYKKPSAYGGGNSSFDSWHIPESLDSTSNGIYTLTCDDQTATITGMGREIGNDGAKLIVMIAVITASSIQISMVN